MNAHHEPQVSAPEVSAPEPAPGQVPPAGPPPAAPSQGARAPAASRPVERPAGGWARRIPELVAGIGAVLVALAATGGVIHSWEWFTDPQRALLLGALGVGLTAAGLWLDDRSRNAGDHAITLAWAAATVLVVAAADLSLGALGAGSGMSDRAAVAAAGLAGAVHAGYLLLRRRPTSVLQQSVVFAALVYAVGPVAPGPTLSAADGWTAEGVLATLATPITGLFGVTTSTAGVIPTGVGLLAIGAVWAVGSIRLTGPAGYTARALAAVALGWSALTLNAADDPIGATLALAIVIGLLVYGMARDDAVLVTAGAIGVTVAGMRVLAAIVSGAALVIVVVGALGIAMIAGALLALRRRAPQRGG